MTSSPTLPPKAAAPAAPTADHLLDALPWGVLVLGAGGIVLRLNQQAAAWWGLGQAVVQGQPVAALAVGHLPAPMHEALQQLAAGGATQPEATFFIAARQQWLSQTSTQQAGQTVVYWHDVTAQKQRDDQYQTLADNLPDLLSRWDAQLRLHYANPAFVARSGRPLAELLGCTSQEMGYPASIAQPWVAALQQAFATGQPQELYTTFPTPQGEVHYYSRLVPELHGGTVATILAVGRNITTLRRAEVAAQQARHQQATDTLHAAEARFGTIVDMVPGLLWRNDAQGHTDWYNQRWFDYTGQTLAEAMDYGWLKALHPDDLAQSLHNFQAAVDSGQPLRQEHRLRSAAGEYRWFQVQALPVYTLQGRIAEWLGSATDIHERRLAENALRQSEEKYRTLFETMDEGFAACELLRDAAGQPSDWRYLELNPAWEHQTGLARAEALSQTARQLLPSLDAWWYAAFGRVVDTGEPARFEHHVNALDRWYQIIAFPQGGERFAVLYDDISARKRTEQQLQSLTASLEQQVAERTHALQVSNDLLQAIYDTSSFAMSVLRAVRDEAGTVVDFRIDVANAELVRATRRTDLVGKLYLAEYPGLRTIGLFDLMLQVLETGEPASLEYRYDQDGFAMWCSSMFVQLGDGLVASNLDITARKHADEELRKSLGLLRQSEQIAELGNWDYELRTGTFTWSAGMYRLFGLPLGSPVSPQTYLDFVVAEDRPIAECLVRHLREGTSGFEKTLRIRVAGQVKTLRLKALMLYDDQEQPLRMLGVDLDISEVQRLEQENLHMRLGQQQARIGAVLEAQEEERRRIAENLHNGLGQMLYATKLQLDQLGQAPQLAAVPALDAARREASRLLSEVIQQARTLSHELTPGIVAEFGLAAALHDICRSLGNPRLRWQCLVHLDAEPPLALPLQVAVYRLAQEVAQNIVKHAHATHATLEVETLPGWLVVRAEDNGRGFEPTDSTPGIGLKTLRHRVALLGGTVHLSATPGRGTQLQLRIPLLTTPSL